jgi:hypothetical protein
MATAVLVAIVLQVITPHAGRLRFWWVFPVLEVAALVAVIVRDPGRIDRRTRAARRTTLVLIALLTVGTWGLSWCWRSMSSTRRTPTSARRRCWGAVLLCG